MREKLFILLLSCCTLFAASQTQWKLGTYSIAFAIKNVGLTVDGSFAGLLADIKFDAANYTKSSIKASIDVNTINTGIDLRNSHLKKEEYFNVAKYPTISIKSNLISQESAGAFKGSFELTIKGITKTVSIPFTYAESGKTSILKGAFTINRRDFDIGSSSWTMSDDVEINIVINAVK